MQSLEFTSDRHTNISETIGNLKIHPLLSTSTRSSDRTANNNPLSNQPVYDIVNCGPRQRFVVKGLKGPFIVHNCVQAISRDILAEQILAAEEFYPVVMHTHDEIVWCVPENEAESAKNQLLAIMRTPPAWCSDVPLDAKADIGFRYGDCK